MISDKNLINDVTLVLGNVIIKWIKGEERRN